ncbi:Trypsin [Popillia japonica]|uniref:Trypsin n=1 Tax=Popillia japonica TaxID=7064 RepID=A0AAW1HUA2_POPJA
MLFLSFLLLAPSAYASIGSDSEDAIINGHNADITDFPYYAFLASGGGLLCGGAFIEEDLVLTAAHCLGDDDITVHSGITYLRNLKRSKGYAVKAVVPHPDFWSTGNSSVDLGLIRLQKKITLGPKAQLIELATEPPPVGGEATVVGFGVMKCVGEARCHEKVKLSKRLRYADIDIEAVEPDGTIVTKSRGNKSTCYGDSGGPIAYNGQIIGVVSSGEYGDCTGYDIQGPVFPLLKWIEETKATM